MKPLSPKQALDRLERTLKTLPVDAWEIYLTTGRTLSVEAREGKVESFCRAVSLGVGIRTLAGTRPGFSHTTDFTRQALDQAARDSAAAARVATPDPAVRFPGPSPLPAKELGIFDPDLGKMPEKKKIEMALDLEEAARSVDARIERVRGAEYEEEVATLTLRNSLGLSREARESALSLSLMAVAAAGGEQEMGYEFQETRQGRRLDPIGVGKGAARRALGQLGAQTLKGRTGPIVLENIVACELLEVLADSFCGDEVQKGRSGLAGKIGRQVFNPALTIVDDGLLRGGMGSFPFDDEGVAQRRTVLVKEGVLRGYLYDTTSAGREKKKPTGNAVRSGGFASSPGVGPTNLCIQKSKKPTGELLRSLGRGLLITELMGVHAANTVTGEFSVGCAGQVVRKGEPAEPFKGMAIAGNLFDLLLAVEEVGADLRFYGDVGSPSLLIGRATVSGK